MEVLLSKFCLLIPHTVEVNTFNRIARIKHSQYSSINIVAFYIYPFLTIVSHLFSLSVFAKTIVSNIGNNTRTSSNSNYISNLTIRVKSIIILSNYWQVFLQKQFEKENRWKKHPSMWNQPAIHSNQLFHAAEEDQEKHQPVRHEQRQRKAKQLLSLK